MFWQAYKEAFQRYFIYLIIAVIIGAVTVPFVFWFIATAVSKLTTSFNVESFTATLLFFVLFAFVLMLYTVPFHVQVAKRTKFKWRTLLFIQLIGTVVLASVLFVAKLFYEEGEQAQFETALYYFPENFKGCAVIFYDVPNAPPLPLTKETLTHRFTSDVLVTSSPSTIGWASADSSGWHSSRYFVGDEEIDASIFHGSNGQATTADQQTFEYTLLTADGSEHCAPMYEDIWSLYNKVVGK